MFLGVVLIVVIIVTGLIVGWLVARREDRLARPYEVRFRGLDTKDDAILAEWAALRLFPSPRACRRGAARRGRTTAFLIVSEEPPEPARLGRAVAATDGWLELVRCGDTVEFVYTDPTRRRSARVGASI
ncbi:MAG: hypothetical protein M3N33_10225 [Actinomycetota bacterium]|nr:hypothetical protein [Actinomycetota bacterium]